jgi:hypothetical protein
MPRSSGASPTPTRQEVGDVDLIVYARNHGRTRDPVAMAGGPNLFVGSNKVVVADTR